MSCSNMGLEIFFLLKMLLTSKSDLTQHLQTLIRQEKLPDVDAACL